MVVFVKVPVILEPLPDTPPVIEPVTDGVVQVYVVPLGTIPFVLFTGVDVKAAPVQTALVIAVMLGLGLTVTVTVKEEPEQEPDVGVTV